MKRLFTLFLLMVVLSTRIGWTMMDNEKSDNVVTEVVIEIRNFDFNVVSEEIQRTETILEQTLDDTHKAVLFEAAMMKLHNGESETAQNDYNELIITARNAGKDNEGDRAIAISKATWIAILHPTIVIDREILHGLLLKSSHNYFAKWVPLNFI